MNPALADVPVTAYPYVVLLEVRESSSTAVDFIEVPLIAYTIQDAMLQAVLQTSNLFQFTDSRLVSVAAVTPDCGPDSLDSVKAMIRLMRMPARVAQLMAVQEEGRC